MGLKLLLEHWKRIENKHSGNLRFNFVKDDFDWLDSICVTLRVIFIYSLLGASPSKIPDFGNKIYFFTI